MTYSLTEMARIRRRETRAARASFCERRSSRSLGCLFDAAARIGLGLRSGSPVSSSQRTDFSVHTGAYHRGPPRPNALRVAVLPSISSPHTDNDSMTCPARRSASSRSSPPIDATPLPLRRRDAYPRTPCHRLDASP
ncbi:hypothetical protein MSAN_02412700 [Mycena sanguinolenta]|uniref:Uncharacterized protein n=1 Tax=Mycena sanguinolenta TaxID=230812 RepID=A0A8H6X3S6_9AGAR|nr:hypothetical protein MSAN_02412700 [Mycena sanguinolenta]